MSFLELIPWKKEEFKAIAKAFISNEKVVLLRAPTGSGKTTVAISYLISQALMGKRGVIFFRTKKEIENALAIARKILENINAELLVLPSPSKEDFCIYNPPRDLVKYWCPISGCDRITRRSSKALEDIIRRSNYRKISDYVTAAARHGLCPYFAIQNMLKDADIVFATHQYLIHKDLFEKLGTLDIAIIDEAHNLFIIKTFESNKQDIELGREIVQKAPTNKLSRLVVALWREGKVEDSKKVALYDVYLVSEGKVIGIGQKIIKVLTPHELIKSRLGNVKKIVIMSATLYPIKLFETVFAKDIPHEKYVVRGLISSEKRRLMILDTDLTMEYKQRSNEMLVKYANIVRKIFLKYNQKLLIFVPSYEIANRLARLLGIEVNKESRLGMLTVMRGRYAEGIELNYKIALILGLPFPRISLEVRRILEYYSQYYRIPQESLEYAYRLSSMLIALIQAIGRVGRREEGVAIIIDRRARKYLYRI